MVEKSVDQSLVWIAVARMDHKAHGLIDDDEGIILIDDVQRDVLGRKETNGGFVIFEFDLLA